LRDVIGRVRDDDAATVDEGYDGIRHLLYGLDEVGVEKEILAFESM
jgi:hypothetical protein